MIQGKLQPGERIGVIDELRGLALVMVVLSHVGLVYGLETDIAYSLALPAFGVGVDLFLVISGFVIYRNLLAMSVKAGGNALLGAQAFWVRRLVRIAAPAAGTLAVVGTVRLAQEGPGASWADLAAALAFFANFYWAGCAASAPPARIRWSPRIFGVYRSKDNFTRSRLRSSPCPAAWPCRSVWLFLRAARAWSALWDPIFGPRDPTPCSSAWASRR
ncbi:MAG: acyltransferase family protein [Methylocystis sp.]